MACLGAVHWLSNCRMDRLGLKLRSLSPGLTIAITVSVLLSSILPSPARCYLGPSLFSADSPLPHVFIDRKWAHARVALALWEADGLNRRRAATLPELSHHRGIFGNRPHGPSPPKLFSNTARYPSPSNSRIQR